MNLKVSKIIILLKQKKDVRTILKDNYKELICFLEKLLISNIDCLENENIELFNNEIIKMIFWKMQKEKELCMRELNIFLYTIYFDVIKLLDLDSKKIEMQCVYPEEKEFSPNCGGVHRYIKDKHYIYYNKSLLEKICKNTLIEGRLFFMNMIVHELVHVKQVEDLNDKEINFNSYIISLEEVVRRNEKYYKKNYKFTKLETDAQDRGLEFLIKVLNKHKVMNKNLLCKLQELSLQYSNEMDARFYNHKIEYKGQNIKNSSYLLLEVEELLIRNRWLLKKYPLLRFSHYSNGILKDYNKLLIEKKEILEWLANENLADYDKLKLEIECIYNYLFKCYNYGDLRIRTRNCETRVLSLSK